MNTVPGPPMNEQIAENSSSQSMLAEKNGWIACVQECHAPRIKPCLGSLDLNAIGYQGQYRHFSTGC